MNNTNIVGANPKNGRRKKDFYPTPPDVTEALLDFLGMIRGTKIWEPACGDGAMTKVMCERGYNVIGTDIATGTDFLTCDPIKCDIIITNPPFSLADQFIRRANELGVSFAFLLKSQYWHAGKRLKLFREIPPSYVMPLTWRPDFTGQGSSLMDMCWCYWAWQGSLFCKYVPLERPKTE